MISAGFGFSIFNFQLAMLPPLEDDPRFAEALKHFAAGDWLEASDLFEELFFEAVRDEVPLVRVLLQISTGMHHLNRGQRRAAVERLEEGLRAIETVTNARGVDLAQLRKQARAVVVQFARNSQEQPD
jgi:predicted metal-dependent hydrolase